ncbi:MAG: Zn-dependent protease [halophilic archaeon J07HB67]|jgi:Zn-dependent protease with chaperone function|nr:MAG: Zn-dependent protease [halophilic archaeon J07HB67]
MLRHQLRVVTTACGVCLLTGGYLAGLIAIGTHLVPLLVNTFPDEQVPVPYPVGGVSVAVVVVAVVAGSLWVGHGLSRRLLRWREPTTAERDRLDGRVDRLAMQFDVTVPRVRVLENATPTAYTLGRPGAPATVVVTTGLLDTLPEEELTAVLAHELAHVANRDATVVSAISAGTVVCGIVYHAAERLGRRANQSNELADFVIEGFFAGVVGTVTLVCWTPMAVLVRRLSRSREFVSDRAAARVTGDPAALASALERIDEQLTDRPDVDARLLEPALDQASLVGTETDGTADPSTTDDLTAPGTEQPWTTQLEQTVLRPVVTHPSVASLFETHPETDARVARLRDPRLTTTD